VPHEFQDSADGFSDDGASEMSDMHFLGDVGRREIYDYLLAFDFWEGEIENQVIDLLFNELIFHFYLEESFFVGVHDGDIVIFEEAFSGFFGEFHNGLAAKGGAFFFVAVDVELLHG
jgi:hypothetical protein